MFVEETSLYFAAISSHSPKTNRNRLQRPAGSTPLFDADFTGFQLATNYARHCNVVLIGCLEARQVEFVPACINAALNG